MMPGKSSLEAPEDHTALDEAIEKLFQDDDDMDLDRSQAFKRRRLDHPSSHTLTTAAPQKVIHPGATKPPVNDKPYYLTYSLLGFIQFRNMQDYNVAQVGLGSTLQ